MPKKNNEVLDLVEKAANQEAEIELLDTDSLETMTLAECQAAKQALEKRRTMVMLQLDGRRLDQTIKIMDAMDSALDNMIGSYDDEGHYQTPTAMDFKFYSDAYKNLVTAFEKVARLDSIDTSGTVGEINLKIEFKA